MGKLRSVLCLMCLLLLIPALIQARRILPLDTRPLVAEKYAGWSGVLTLWVYEGWPCGSGSISPWLNQCVADFERAHPGVYVQPQFVDAGAISSVNESGIIPPDMLLFPPDLLTAPEGLVPLQSPDRIRDALSRCGTWHGLTYAVPIATGGYLWAWNTELTEALPDSWDDVDAVLSVPVPQGWRRWNVALLALCSGRYAPSRPNASPESTPAPADEVELGLGGEKTAMPTASSTPRDGMTLSRRLPSDFHYDEDAWRLFINGESAAMPVTQREVRRLQALSEQGKGPQWQLAPGDSAFTDQLLALAIVDRREADTRQDLCNDFLTWLLSDECQSSLCVASAFAVTDAPSGYSPSDPLATMDALLRDPGLSVPRMFDGQWVADSETIVREFTSNCGEAPALWRRLRTILVENTNN